MLRLVLCAVGPPPFIPFVCACRCVRVRAVHTQPVQPPCACACCCTRQDLPELGVGWEDTGKRHWVNTQLGLSARSTALCGLAVWAHHKILDRERPSSDPDQADHEHGVGWLTPADALLHPDGTDEHEPLVDDCGEELHGDLEAVGDATAAVATSGTAAAGSARPLQRRTSQAQQR